ncbi:MAG TPA: C45 family peptidase, partial [Tepidisphaeraceae bacterium]|nr:C45 family peptidase [Tepidisphaeraceae bacterium]
HGTPAEMGASHGKQLAKPIDVLREKYLKVFLGGAAKRFVAMAAARSFEKQILPEHLAEINALARQTGMSPEEAVLAQCFLDLTPMQACSTIALPATASPDHVARLGRNLDFPALNIADKYTTLIIYRPDDGRYKFAAVAWPGMIGVLSGINEHGLALANMEVTRGARVPDAMPYTLLYRMLLERCKMVDEAIALLKKTPRQTPNNLMLMDAAGNRAVVEITPAAITVRRGIDGAALISTNHQRGQDADTAGRCVRYDYLHDTAKKDFGSVEEKTIEQMLAGASQADFTLQSMVFEPANRVIYLSAGKNAARGEFHRLDLKPFFAEVLGH